MNQKVPTVYWREINMHKWLFVRLYTEPGEETFITQVYDDLEYAKASCDFVKRKHKEDCILLDKDCQIVYDTRKLKDTKP